MTEGRFDDFARWLDDQHRRGVGFASFGDDWGIETLDDAYDAQDAYVARMLAAEAASPVGWKIGLTSAPMQRMCGIDQPVAGVVLDRRAHASGTTVERARYGRMGLEFEICIRLAEDLPARPAPYSAAEVAAAVDSVASAIEIVDDRNCDYAALDVRSLIADNAWNAGVVLGDWAPVPADLAGCEGIVTLDGAEVDRGFGRDVLGTPLAPLEWLANHLSARGRGLRKNELVMTGSLVSTRFPDRPGRHRFDVRGVGAVELVVTDRDAG